MVLVGGVVVKWQHINSIGKNYAKIQLFDLKEDCKKERLFRWFVRKN